MQKGCKFIAELPQAIFGLNFLIINGEGGIRTHVRLAPQAVFKTAAFNHSATSPCFGPAAGDGSRNCYHLSRSALPTFFKQNTTAEASRGRILPGPRKAGPAGHGLLLWRFSILLLWKNMTENPESDLVPFELKTQTLPNGYKVTYRNDCELEVIYDDIFRKNVYFFEADTREPFIIDCGGHIGLAVLYFKSLYPHARILSFEPNPETFALLQKNIAQKDLRGVEAMNMALTRDGKKDAILYVGENFLQAWDSTDTVEPNLWVNMHEYRGIPVRSTRLSPYINQRVDFLKLDIEGSEVAVVDELDGKLAAVAALTLEYHQNPANLAEGKLQKIIEKLSGSGFRCEIFHEAESVALHQLPTDPVFQLIVRATR